MSEEPKIIEKQGYDEELPQVQKQGDVYLLRSRTRDVWISEEKLKELKRLYCGNPPLTVNQICRELDIPRPDFFVIKTAMGITHDDVPYLDHEVEDSPIDDLVEETLQRKKKQYFVKLQQSEAEMMRKDSEQFRKDKYQIEFMSKLISETIQELSATPTVIPAIKIDSNIAKLMLEVSIVDLHFSKLAWKPETGENYDYKIAEERFEAVIDDIIERVSHRAFQKIVFVFGNDYLHFDNINTTTTAGTPLDADLRWTKLFVKGGEMLVRAIDRLSALAPVEVILVPGNHDRMTSFMLLQFLRAWYRNINRVTVNDDPRTRKYIEFGKCLIGFTHGDKERSRIFGNMQVEVPEAWGRTTHREWHTAHIHSEEVKEHHGVIVRRLTTVTGIDAWHFEQGYVGALCRSQSFIWDKERGLCDILFTNLERG